MAAFILESLVLRGVAVLRGAKAVELRLGTSVEAGWLASGANPKPPMRPDQNGRGLDADASSSSGTGRSYRWSRLSETTAARTALGRGLTGKETAHAVAVPSRTIPTSAVPASVTPRALKAPALLPARLLPPGRTPPASFRGKA